eukprot:TRINITY_DN1955_c0_g2_i7.p1 TRINITY_DN1955_c0_g2~~TRINITY_DN1955_c0_g2_i7.p1  ORF type:complete len:404 (-),score=84.60 TRINITY_DN1955_c0_g2_i7:11-1222(-)
MDANSPKSKMMAKPAWASNVITQVRKDDSENEKRAKVQVQKKEAGAMSFVRHLCKCILVNRWTYTQEEKPILGPQPLNKRGKKTLVLDLDETLVHSTFDYIPNPDLRLNISIQGNGLEVLVRKRPGVDEFMRRMAKHYEIVIFTASLAEYAHPLIQRLDEDKVVDYELYRDSCTFFRGSFIKDLSKLGRNLKDIIIVDNSENSFAFQPMNAVFIKSYFDDPRDIELEKWTEFLEFLSEVNDVRPVNVWKETFDRMEDIDYLDMNRTERVYQRKPMTARKSEWAQEVFVQKSHNSSADGKNKSLLPSITERLKGDQVKYEGFYTQREEFSEENKIGGKIILNLGDEDPITTNINLNTATPKETDKLIEFIPKKSKLGGHHLRICLLYTSPSPRDRQKSRMPSSA